MKKLDWQRYFSLDFKCRQTCFLLNLMLLANTDRLVTNLISVDFKYLQQRCLQWIGKRDKGQNKNYYVDMQLETVGMDVLDAL